jgi:hypothetical protein
MRFSTSADGSPPPPTAPWCATLAAGLLLLAPTCVLPRGLGGELVIDFADLSLPAGSDFYNGSDGAGGWSSGGAVFGNQFTDWGGGFVSWSGFSYSRVRDATTAGFGNQYAAFSGGAYAGEFYAVGYGGGPESYINLPEAQLASSVRLTNTTYTALAMRDGDDFARPFESGDFFKVSLIGFSGQDASGQVTGQADFYLADFRDGQNWIVQDWTLLDLTPLGTARSIGLQFDSSDVDPIFGINTPVYVALDSLVLTAVPEPSTLGLVALAAALLLTGRGVQRFKRSHRPPHRSPAGTADD